MNFCTITDRFTDINYQQAKRRFAFTVERAHTTLTPQSRQPLLDKQIESLKATQKISNGMLNERMRDRQRQRDTIQRGEKNWVHEAAAKIVIKKLLFCNNRKSRVPPYNTYSYIHMHVLRWKWMLWAVGWHFVSFCYFVFFFFYWQKKEPFCCCCWRCSGRKIQRIYKLNRTREMLLWLCMDVLGVSESEWVNEWVLCRYAWSVAVYSLFFTSFPRYIFCAENRFGCCCK